MFVWHIEVTGQLSNLHGAHLSKRSVKVGQMVVQGQQIGKAGNTGHSFGSHLHFEIYYGGASAKKPPAVKSANRINPVSFIGLKNRKGIQSI